MRNDFRVQIRVEHQDVFGGFVDAPDAHAALELAVKEALAKDLSGIKGSREKRGITLPPHGGNEELKETYDG